MRAGVKAELRESERGCPYLVAENRNANVSFFVDPRVVDLRREFHLCVVWADKANQGDRCDRVSETGKKKTEAKISMSMISHSGLREGRAERVWNSYYRRSFEWKVFGQIEVEMKRPAFVWALGLATITVSGSVEGFLGCWRGASWTHGRFDCAFPVEETGIVICDRETLKGGTYERQESEWTRRLSGPHR